MNKLSLKKPAILFNYQRNKEVQTQKSFFQVGYYDKQAIYYCVKANNYFKMLSHSLWKI